MTLITFWYPLDIDLIIFVKVVYLTRNVKDNIISAMHHYNNVDSHGYKGDIDTFVSYFTRGLCKYPWYITDNFWTIFYVKL